MTKSICIATYNGSDFIREQLSSILQQIDFHDEIIIVDDCSKDNTVEIIQSYTDNRIKLIQNSRNSGHVRTFEKAISLASNELVFLSDQDDVWTANRIEIFVNQFQNNSSLMLATSNFHCINQSGELIPNNLNKVAIKDSLNNQKNLLSIFFGRIGYFGCAMAFRKSLIEKILPIPKYVEAHDLWIAMAANLLKANIHIESKTLYHRVHDKNASNLNRSVFKKIQSRLNFLKQYRELLRRIK